MLYFVVFSRRFRLRFTSCVYSIFVFFLFLLFGFYYSVLVCVFIFVFFRF